MQYKRIFWSYLASCYLGKKGHSEIHSQHNDGRQNVWLYAYCMLMRQLSVNHMLNDQWGGSTLNIAKIRLLIDFMRTLTESTMIGRFWSQKWPYRHNKQVPSWIIFRRVIGFIMVLLSPAPCLQHAFSSPVPHVVL